MDLFANLRFNYSEMMSGAAAIKNALLGIGQTAQQTGAQISAALGPQAMQGSQATFAGFTAATAAMKATAAAATATAAAVGAAGTAAAGAATSGGQLAQMFGGLVSNVRTLGGALSQNTSNLMQFRNTLAGAAVAVDVVAVAVDKLAMGMISSFQSQESAFAGIRKTINATEEEFQNIKSSLQDLSNRTPVKFEDLAKIGELAGQLGVRGTENIIKFTDTIARISVSTNLTVEGAAVAFARLSNIMQEPIQNIDKVASSVVALGNNFATTESEIVNFALRIAGAGKIAGLTTADIMGIGAAFTSVGVKAEAGGTAIQKMLIDMTKAVADGGEHLELFGLLANKTGKAFAESFKADPAKAFISVVEGLAGAGDKAFMALEALTGNNARVIRAFLSAANAGDLLRNAMEMAGLKIRDTSALMNESNQRFATFENTVKTLYNTFIIFAAMLGETLMPILRPLAMVTTEIMIGFQKLPEPIKAFIAMTIGATAVVFTLLGGLVSLTFIIVALEAAVVALGGIMAGTGGAAAIAAMGTAGTATAITLGGLLTTVGWVILAIAALGLGVYAVVKYFDLFKGAAGVAKVGIGGVGEAAKESTTLWEDFKGGLQAVADTFRGLGIVILDFGKGVWDVTKEFVVEAWQIIVDAAKPVIDILKVLWNELGGPEVLALIKDVGGMIISEIVAAVKAVWYVIEPVVAAVKYLRDLGKASREEAEKNTAIMESAMRQDTNMLAVELERRNQSRVISDAFKNKLDAEGVKKQKHIIDLQESQMKDSLAMQTLVYKTMHDNLNLTDSEYFEKKYELLNQDLANVAKSYNLEMGLASRMLKGGDDARVDAQKKREEGNRKVIGGIIGVNSEERIQLRLTKEAMQAAGVMQIDMSEKVTEAIRQQIIATNREMKLIGLSPIAAAMQAIDNAYTIAMDDLDKLIQMQDASDPYQASMSRQRQTQEQIKRDTLTFEELIKGFRESMAAVRGGEEAMGLEAWTVEYQKLIVAQQVYYTSYKDLLPWQRDYIDVLAESKAEQERNKLVTEQQTMANNALMVGLSQLIGMEDAKLAQDIKRREARLQSVLETLTTINDAERKSALLQSQILEQAIIRNSKMWVGFGETITGTFAFITARTRQYIAEQETVWQGLGKLIVGVFDSVQRTLSDVLFNFFTTGTFKLADAWKSMLNSMLRSLSDFLATQTMKIFLSFLFGGATSGLSGKAGEYGASLVGATGNSGLLGQLVNSIGKSLGFDMSSTTDTSVGTIASEGSVTTNVSRTTGPDVYNAPASVSYTDVPSYDSYDSYDMSDYSSDVPDYSYDYGDLAFASGGRVPGSGRGDIVPAMLEPGEFVIRRSVASALGPALDALNSYGRPSSGGGRLFMQSGGPVPSMDAAMTDVQTLGALQKMGYLMEQQLAMQQRTAENTGLTATALTGAEAPAPTAGFTSIVGSGGDSYPVTIGGTGASSSATGMTDQSSVAALTGGGSSSSTSSSSASSLLTGGMNLAFGASSGNPLQMLGGSLSLLGGIAGLSTSQDSLNSIFGSSDAGKTVSSTIGAAGSALGLYAGVSSIIKNGVSVGNITGSILSAYNLYSSISSLTKGAVPSFSSVVANSLSSIAPDFATWLYGSAAGDAAGLAATEAGIGLGAGEIGAGVLSGLGSYIPVVGMIIQAVTSYFGNKDMMDFLKGGYVNNPIKGALYSNATLGVQNANNIVDWLHAQGMQQSGPTEPLQPGINVVGSSGVSTDDLMTAASSISQNLLPYYATAQGGVGAIKASDTVAGGYGNMSEYVANFTKAQSGMVEAIHELLARGVSYEDIGKLKGGNWLQPMLNIGNPLSEYYAGDAAKFDTEAYQLISHLGHQIDVTQPGDPLGPGIPTGPYYLDTPDGRLVPIQPGMLTPQLLLQAIGSHEYETTGVDRMYGGSVWAALARMGGAISPDIRALIQAHFDPWAEARTMSPEQLGSFVAGPLLQAYTTAPVNAGGGPGGSASGPAGAGPAAAGDSGDSGGMQTGGWTIPGTGTGDHMWTRLEPGEYVVPRPQAKMYATQLQNLSGVGGAEAGAQAIHYNVSITINGDVPDPEELARILAPRLRDELQRINPRFSRAGNKAQV